MLSEKKRIIMVPKKNGMDFLSCENGRFMQGPLNYYLTKIPRSVNVFDLFSDRKNADAVIYAIQTNEVKCQSSLSPYFDIFFERDYLEHLQQLSSIEQPQKRGGISSKSSNPEYTGKHPGRKLALIVATDTFDTKDQWNFYPPRNDARAIGDTLKNQYGYEVEFLFNKNKKIISSRFLFFEMN